MRFGLKGRRAILEYRLRDLAGLALGRRVILARRGGSLVVGRELARRGVLLGLVGWGGGSCLEVR